MPAEKINDRYGYRSKRARQNRENWAIANKLFANLCLFFGVATSVIGGWSYHHQVPHGRSITILFGLVQFLFIVWFIENQLKRRDGDSDR